MTTTRTYRKTMESKEALREIEKRLTFLTQKTACAWSRRWQCWPAISLKLNRWPARPLRGGPVYLLADVGLGVRITSRNWQRDVVLRTLLATTGSK